MNINIDFHSLLNWLSEQRKPQYSSAWEQGWDDAIKATIKHLLNDKPILK